MQNAQMHQMVMQQMMLSAIPKNNSLPPIGSTTEAQVRNNNSNFIKWLQIPPSCYPCFGNVLLETQRPCGSSCFVTCAWTLCYPYQVQRCGINTRIIQFHYVADFLEDPWSVHTDLLAISQGDMGKNVLHPFLSGIAIASSKLSVNAPLTFMDKSWLLKVFFQFFFLFFDLLFAFSAPETTFCASSSLRFTHTTTCRVGPSSTTIPATARRIPTVPTDATSANLVSVYVLPNNGVTLRLLFSTVYWIISKFWHFFNEWGGTEDLGKRSGYFMTIRWLISYFV